jgi:hypothetical protein
VHTKLQNRIWRLAAEDSPRVVGTILYDVELLADDLDDLDYHEHQRFYVELWHRLPDLFSVSSEVSKQMCSKSSDYIEMFIPESAQTARTHAQRSVFNSDIDMLYIDFNGVKQMPDSLNERFDQLATTEVWTRVQMLAIEYAYVDMDPSTGFFSKILACCPKLQLIYIMTDAPIITIAFRATDIRFGKDKVLRFGLERSMLPQDSVKRALDMLRRAWRAAHGMTKYPYTVFV